MSGPEDDPPAGSDEGVERSPPARRPPRREPTPERRRPRRPRDEDDDPPDDGGVSTLIPYRNGYALGAYYCGVFSLIPIFGMVLGPVALILGIVGLRYVKKHPTAKGTGHAIAGVVMGSLTTLGHLSCIGFIIVSVIASAPSGPRY
jgi:hypothetical protein